ncbi:MAG: hypothetical protein GY867_01410 [bacterium]|nr:hypothetical protein [bacterium]
MSNNCSLVLGLLSDGRINVNEAERLIRRLVSTRPAVQRRVRKSNQSLVWPSHVKWPSHVPPHLPTGFGAQNTSLVI